MPADTRHRRGHRHRAPRPPRPRRAIAWSNVGYGFCTLLGVIAAILFLNGLIGR